MSFWWVVGILAGAVLVALIVTALLEFERLIDHMDDQS